MAMSTFSNIDRQVGRPFLRRTARSSRARRGSRPSTARGQARSDARATSPCISIVASCHGVYGLPLGLMRCGSSSTWSRRVPAVGRNVDPAAHRQPVVDDDDLLVMAAARPGASCRSGSRSPWSAHQRHSHSTDGGVEELLERAEIPLEDVDLPLGLFLGEAEEEAAQRFALAMLVGVERDARVEVPADDEDALLAPPPSPRR